MRAEAEPGSTKRPAVTIYDVAKHLGVNPSTVSRALSKPGRLSARTEERIRAAADELGYQLNPVARALQTGKTQTIGLLVSDITNPVYFELIRGAERVCASHGYTIVLAETQESPTQEAEAARRLSATVDGLILVGTRLDDESINDFGMRSTLVVVNRAVDGVASIVPDVSAGIEQALEHLLELGHRRVTYLAGPESSYMNRRRWEVLLDAAIEREMTISEIGSNAPTRDGGRSAFRRVRASGATAVFAFNDLMAIGLQLEYQAQGLPVPAEISIVGFDDIFGSDFTTPALTTIHSPLGVLGETAARTLIEGAQDVEPGALPTSLIIRNSTGLVPHAV